MSKKTKIQGKDASSPKKKTETGNTRSSNAFPMDFQQDTDIEEKNWANILTFDTDSLMMVDQKKDNTQPKFAMNEQLIMLRRERSAEKNSFGSNQRTTMMNPAITEDDVHDVDFLKQNAPRMNYPKINSFNRNPFRTEQDTLQTSNNFRQDTFYNTKNLKQSSLKTLYNPAATSNTKNRFFGNTFRSFDKTLSSGDPCFVPTDHQSSKHFVGNGVKFSEKYENDCMVTSYGDTKFIEFQKSSSGFINKTELKKHNEKIKFAMSSYQAEMEDTSVFNQFQTKNTSHNITSKKGFKKTSKSNLAQKGILNKMENKVYNKLATRGPDEEFDAINTEISGFTTKSQFYPFKQLLQKDDKLSRDIAYYSSVGDQFNLIKYKLKNNRIKARDHYEEIVRSDVLKKHFFYNMVNQNNEKLELMTKVTHVVPIKQTECNQAHTVPMRASHAKKCKDINQDTKKKVSEFENMFNNIEFCFSSAVEGNKISAKPDSREGHTLNIITLGDKRIVFVHGGMSGNLYNEFEGFEVGRWNWKPLNMFGPKEQWDPRYGHSINQFYKKIILFGGAKSYNSMISSLQCTNEMVIYDLTDKSMIFVRVPFGGPSPRKYHTAVISYNQLYIIGGVTQKNSVLNDIWTYNFGVRKWSQCRVDYKEAPDIGENGIAQNTCQLIKSDDNSKKLNTDPTVGYLEGIYMFGGRNDDAAANNDLLVLKINDSPVKFVNLQTNGEKPAPRFGHTMGFLSSCNHLAIFGGIGSNYGETFGDLWTISIEKLSWNKVKISGSLPEPRSNHGMVVDRDALIIFGGINDNGFLASDIYCTTLVDRNTKKKYESYDTMQIFKSYFSKITVNMRSLTDVSKYNKDGLQDDSDPENILEESNEQKSPTKRRKKTNK